MTERLDARFAKLKKEGRAGLITFTMGYDPSREDSLEILKALPKAGADILELGIPFSDPMADGPIIQEAGERALQAGATLKGILSIVSEFRKTDKETPIILMGYYNPIFRYGPEQFVHDAVSAGADGAIIVDLPPEEIGELQPAATAYNFALVRLIAPTTPDSRLSQIMRNARGFAYTVAVAGITGAGSANLDMLEARVKHLKKHVKLPLAVGFGVKTPEQAARISTFADGVVVGSALVDLIAQHADDDVELLKEVQDFVRALASGIQNPS